MSCRILEGMLGPVGQCQTAPVALRTAARRVDSRTQSRLDELAEKNAEGTPTPHEEAEHEAYVEALGVIAILHAKARMALKAAGRAK